CEVLQLRTTVTRGVERSRLASQLRERVRELEAANETNRALNLELEQRVEAATAELRQQITARDEFMAIVSHDLKSPLTFIKGMANLRRRRAIKYSPRGGAIDVAVDVADGCVVVRVSDMGEGIPEADLPHIFERFRRGRNVEGRIPGTGIGLAGVRSIIEMHHGSIGVESQVG